MSGLRQYSRDTRRLSDIFRHRTRTGRGVRPASPRGTEPRVVRSRLADFVNNPGLDPLRAWGWWIPELQEPADALLGACEPAQECSAIQECVLPRDFRCPDRAILEQGVVPVMAISGADVPPAHAEGTRVVSPGGVHRLLEQLARNGGFDARNPCKGCGSRRQSGAVRAFSGCSPDGLAGCPVACGAEVVTSWPRGPGGAGQNRHHAPNRLSFTPFLDLPESAAGHRGRLPGASAGDRCIDVYERHDYRRI